MINNKNILYNKLLINIHRTMATYFDLLPEEMLFEIVLYFNDIKTFDNLILVIDNLHPMKSSEFLYRRLIRFLASRKNRLYMVPPDLDYLMFLSLYNLTHAILLPKKEALGSYTLLQLKQMAKSKGVHRYHGKTKRDLINMILNANKK